MRTPTTPTKETTVADPEIKVVAKWYEIRGLLTAASDETIAILVLAHVLGEEIPSGLECVRHELDFIGSMLERIGNAQRGHS